MHKLASNQMHDFFHVQTDEIKALDDGQARELVARLCKAQMRKNGRNDVLVEWGGNQRAPDGGFDVFSNDPDGPSLSEMLNASKVGVQVKAELFIPSRIPDEMAPGGVIRETIRELNAVEGIYAIASTKDDCSFSMLESREAKMKEVVAQHELTAVGVKFLDVRRMASWCEQFPEIVLWVKEKAGITVAGWKPFGSWSRRGNADAKFLSDDRLRVLDRNSEAAISTAQAIDSIRRELVSGGSSVRIVGLSGTGKTRFVQALFEQVDTTLEEPLNKDWVIYTDLNHQPNPTPEAIAERLVLEDKRSVLVVDNCGADLHGRLNEMIQSSQVDVLTIEYDVRDDFAERTSFFHIKETGDEVIEEFLQNRFDTLSDADVGKVVQFCGGNFRLAISLASTATEKGQLAHLQDNELFSRLFVQGSQIDTDLRRFAEVLSLVYSFDAEGAGPRSELAWLASIANCSVIDLFGAVAELHDRDLLQRRGRWAAVLPHAIANRLAGRAIRRLPVDHFLGEIDKNPQLRIAHSFSRRLGYLHDIPEAQNLADKLINENSRFSDYSSLCGSEIAFFRNLAAANQEAALANIERFVDLVANGGHRHDVVEASRLLYHLAYEETYFSKAFELLVRLRKFDLQRNGPNDVFDTLKILFYPLGSGTIAPPKARHDKIECLLKGDATIACSPKYYCERDCKQTISIIFLDTNLEHTLADGGCK